ncbi:MAG: DNA-directed RNA polymerase subunit alpha [Planctomycetota bacterium]|jgi:DNA-directed RNA polymerase subunit alpha
MRIRWRNLELPTRVVAEEATHNYGRFVAEPFERGFGTTVGNGLRRVLLSSIEGAAVTSIKIQGVRHEFTALPGMVEDITDVVLNIKKLLVRLHSDGPATLRIERTTKGAVTAADVICDPGAEIVNPELHICTLADDGEFICEMTARRGRGYVTAEENEQPEPEIGTIPVDSIFSPVHRVRYRIVDTRVGKLTNYDKLVLEIWTDGTVSPADALVEASKIYRKHLNPFVQYGFAGAELPVEDTVEDAMPLLPEPEPQVSREALALRERLLLPISDLDLSVRASNCLESENVRTIGDLVRLSENELLNLKNFGKTSLREIKLKLINSGLELGMDVDAVGT